MTDRQEGEAGRCVRPARLPHWTRERRKVFLETLEETSNVSASARAAGMDRSSAYALKGRDEAFARDWKVALERGYSDLELQLLQHAREGTIRTEKVIDGKTAKVKQIRVIHSFPLTIAMRLLLSHSAEVEAFRRDGWDDGMDDADIERLNARLDRVRERLLSTDNLSGEADVDADDAEPAGE